MSDDMSLDWMVTLGQRYVVWFFKAGNIADMTIHPHLAWAIPYASKYGAADGCEWAVVEEGDVNIIHCSPGAPTELISVRDDDGHNKTMRRLTQSAIDAIEDRKP